MNLTDEIKALDDLIIASVPPAKVADIRGKIHWINEQAESIEKANAELFRTKTVADNVAQSLRAQLDELTARNPSSFHKEDVEFCKYIRSVVGHIETSKHGKSNPSAERDVLEGIQTMVEGIKSRAKNRLGVSDIEVP